MALPPATMTDVAARAGVSVSTVSRVLNGVPGVAEAKREAVLAAIRALGYTPNALARALVSGRSMCVGVLVQVIGDPYVGEFLHGVNRALAEGDYQPVIAVGEWRAEQEARAVRHLLARPVDALIVQDGSLPDAALRDIAARVPLVAMGRALPPDVGVGLTVDHEAGAFAAVRHLLALGHRRIAHLAGPPDQPHARARLAGYLRALEGVGLGVDPALIAEGDFWKLGGARATRELVARGAPFTALFTGNDEMAFGALHALRELGRRVPEDVSVVGFDDLHLAFAEVSAPPLTTVRQPVLDMGVAAGRAALALLHGESLPPTAFEVRLVERASCAPPRAG